MANVYKNEQQCIFRGSICTYIYGTAVDTLDELQEWL